MATTKMIETASGDKLIVFTPGEDRDKRFEADVLKNTFSGYSLGPVEESEKYPGWLSFSFGIPAGWGEDDELSADVLMQGIERENPAVGMGRMFSHVAIAYEGGAHIIAVKSAYSEWWYRNTAAPAFATTD